MYNRNSPKRDRIIEERLSGGSNEINKIVHINTFPQSADRLVSINICLAWMTLWKSDDISEADIFVTKWNHRSMVLMTSA